MPWINDLLDQLKGGKYFSNIHLNQSFNEVLIEPFDVWKTTFKSNEGLFEWLVKLFGLKYTPITFMRLMNDILWTFTNAFMVVYLDDILIFNQSLEEPPPYSTAPPNPSIA